MYYEDENGQLSLVKPEKINKKYEFFGNVYVNESLRETRALKTEAPSLKKAINISSGGWHRTMDMVTKLV